MKQTLSITRKELSAYFGSPMALLFIGVFLAVTLLAFFWVDAFFDRGIADVRPLFRWMPVLLIFLVAALTMRQWSEEERSGTLEMLLTLPVSKVQLVLGKFVAVLTLVAVSLALTLFLPITVSLMGRLDWGPVAGGYLAALLMAAAYAAIGLFISSRTDNQLVSLILTLLVGGLFYLVGTSTIVDAVGRGLGQAFAALGSGSRFESIQRGVIDLRDLIYYLTLAGIFLVLNIVSLDRKRWSVGAVTAGYRRGVTLTSALLVTNLIAANVWLYPLSGLRLDLTSQREYSLSGATMTLLRSLAEPLTIRAYVSEKTHPLLAPLAPQLSDMLREYEIAGQGKVAAEVVDPTTDPEIEIEANQTYGIQPTPFQIAGRYESSLINAYFDVLVRYGDQSQVLNFRDLIEVESLRDGTVDVRFGNLEYDLTSAVKKAVYGFQSVDTLLASLQNPARLTLYATPKTVPADLQGVSETITKVAQEMAGKSNGKLTFETVDPDAAGARMTRQQIFDTYKLRPIAVSLFSNDSYYLDMVLTSAAPEGGEETWQLVSPAGDLSESSVRAAIESALKRTSTGFLKVVGLWTPPAVPTQDMFGQTQQALRTWQYLQQQLAEDYTVQAVDLSGGQVPPEVDVLVLISPQNFDDKMKFAVDQYLMRGGAVVVAAGNYEVTYDQYAGNLGLIPIQGGINDMLAHYGVTVEQKLVMDPQNEPFPVQVARKVGNLTVNEMQAINYPFFVDVRSDGMDQASPIVSKLTALTLNWASPLTVDETKNEDREVTTLLKSTANAWLRTDVNIQPDMETYPDTGFAVEGERSVQTLAVSVQGVFDSYFAGKASPLAQAPQAESAAPDAATPTPAPQTGGALEASSAAARLVVIGSGDFLTDVVFQISASMSADRYRNSLQFIKNAVDWSVEDLDLLDIRSRGQTTRVLAPMSATQKTIWEVVNWGLALAALIGIWALWHLRRRNEQPMTLQRGDAAASAK